MVFRIIDAASEYWRYVNNAHLVALAWGSGKFEEGLLIGRRGEAEVEVEVEA